MATIAISLCGEGRGHATRISTLIERLEREHDVLVYTAADAFRFLEQRFATGHPRVTVREIPGIIFEYSGGRLDVPRTIRAGLEYQARSLGDDLRGVGQICHGHVDISGCHPATGRAKQPHDQDPEVTHASLQHERWHCQLAK